MQEHVKILSPRKEMAEDKSERSRGGEKKHKPLKASSSQISIHRNKKLWA